MLGDADAVAEGDLGNRDAVLDRGIQIDVIRTDSGGERQLELGRPLDPVRCQVGGPERLRDDDFRIGKVLVEYRVLAVLVRGHDQLVAETLEVAPQAELTGDAAKQRARREVDRRRCGQRLPVGVAVQVRKPVTRVGLRIAVDGIVIQHANYLGHVDYLSLDSQIGCL